MEYGERSLGYTPTWAVATVISIIVAFGFFFQVSLKRFGKWLDETKRKSLLAALDKIKQELMLFGLLSLIMGHWIVFVAKICIKSSVLSTRFYPCASKDDNLSVKRLRSLSGYSNNSFPVGKMAAGKHDYCPEGHESFASYESLEQLHRFIFVLGVTHVSYSFIAIALAMIKIYSWRRWESEANSLAIRTLHDTPEAAGNGTKLRRLSTFIFHHASHPWSRHKVFVWLLCFSRQFWSSINRVDYMALRLGFITTHQLPLLYNFHNYMLRSMEEEFRDIVGISVPLWIYAIACIFLNFHGSNTYFWLSFLPIINAFEMATFLWSLWEIQEPSCFMDNQTYFVIRLVFGIISQIWCSFVTFPLYVIITQMGSRFKKSIVSENVRKSLHGWKRRVKKARQSSSSTIPLLGRTALSVSDSDIDDTRHQIDTLPSNGVEEDDTINSRVSSFTNRRTSSSISHRDSEAFEPSLNDDQDYSSSEEEEQLTMK